MADTKELPPPVDIVTFDLGWNKAIAAAAETAAVAVALAEGDATPGAAEAVKKLVLGLKRVDITLHAPDAAFTHVVRSTETT